MPNTQVETVFLRSPQGEIREVPANPADLTPLMAAGWVQTRPTEKSKDKKES